MATKKAIKEWLKESMLTESDVQAMWENLQDTNILARNMIKRGVKWQDMNMSVIKQIPFQKEHDLARLFNSENKELVLEVQDDVKRKARQYYLSHLKELLFDKIDSGIKLTETELRDLVGHGMEETEGETHRWTRTVETIVELQGKYYLIEWERGLTEQQENSYSNQPYEVEQVERVVVVKNWVPVGEK